MADRPKIKFGVISPDPTVLEPVAHVYPSFWQRQRTSGPDCLIASPSGGHVSLLLQLAQVMEEPFWLLYVLTLSRCGAHEPGRYQSAHQWSRSDVTAFSRRYQQYFESDGRHHVWLANDESQIVYDNHNLLYLYGPLDTFENVLTEAGLSRGSVEVPAPHTHCYHAEFDRVENEIISEHSWTWFPLVPEHDNP